MPVTRAFAVAVIATAMLAVSATAQTGRRISGKTFDTAGQPVAGARVVLEPDGRATVSEGDGTFTFYAVRPGAYRIAATRIGYAPTSAEVAIGTADAVVTLVFTAIPALLDSVVVRERRSGLSYRPIVVDESGAPVMGADVEVLTGSLRFTTDAAGRVPSIAAARGTVILRVRKIGFAPVLKTVRLLAEREDTVRMQHLAQTLAAAVVLERSGFGRDTRAYGDLATRMKWRGAIAGVISRDELDAQGRTNLCDALPNTPTGAKLGMSVSCAFGPVSILIDGVRQSCTPLTSFYADQVEAIEYYPPGSDWSGSFAARVTGGCGGGRASNRSSRPSRQGGGFVIWMRPSRP